MSRARPFSVVLIAVLLAACGSGTTAGPAARNGVLLRAADLPDMRIRSQSPLLPVPAALEDVIGGGIVFKDPVAKVIGQLKAYGFQRAYAEQWAGAGTLSGAFVVQFATSKDLSGMLKYMNGNLFEECPGDPTCSIKTILSVPAIPGSYGQTLHPNRDPTEGLGITSYKVIFRVRSLIFGMEIGGDEIYDPGTVPLSTALAAFKTFYNHVKTESTDQIFNSVPKTPLGPPPGGGPGGPPASFPPGAVPTGTPS